MSNHTTSTDNTKQQDPWFADIRSRVFGWVLSFVMGLGGAYVGLSWKMQDVLYDMKTMQSQILTLTTNYERLQASDNEKREQWGRIDERMKTLEAEQDRIRRR
jgi:hypothetical protein